MLAQYWFSCVVLCMVYNLNSNCLQGCSSKHHNCHCFEVFEHAHPIYWRVRKRVFRHFSVSSLVFDLCIILGGARGKTPWSKSGSTLRNAFGDWRGHMTLTIVSMGWILVSLGVETTWGVVAWGNIEVFEIESSRGEAIGTTTCSIIPNWALESHDFVSLSSKTSVKNRGTTCFVETCWCCTLDGGGGDCIPLLHMHFVFVPHVENPYSSTIFIYTPTNFKMARVMIWIVSYNIDITLDV